MASYCSWCPETFDSVTEYQEHCASQHEEWKSIHIHSKCGGRLIYEDDEYGSLGDGGSYEIYRCNRCNERVYSMMPD